MKIWIRNDVEGTFNKYITPKGELKEAQKEDGIRSSILHDGISP